MFKKTFRVKTNTQLKTSERKALKDLLASKLTGLSNSDLETLLPKKEIIYCAKIVTANNKSGTIYIVQKRPLVVNIDDVFIPTVYLLWQYPELGVTFTTNTFVFSKIAAGADLMVPGVINQPAKTQTFRNNELAVINTNENLAPMAVGVTAMSSSDLRTANGGKCVIVYHYWGDKLCTMDDMPLMHPPHLKPVECNLDQIDEFPPLVPNNNPVTKEEEPQENIVEAMNEVNLEEKQDVEEHNEDEKVEINQVQHMDNLLVKSFFTAIKYSKTLQLPILTSSFYKVEMLSNCPEGETIDVKKSSYKKVGQFLKQMEKDGLIQIKEKKKGVETIESINKEHESYIHFYLDINERPKKPTTSEEGSSNQTTVTESYLITQPVLPIFKEFGFNKGEALQRPNIRKYVTMYVKNNNFQDPENLRLIKVKGTILQNLCPHDVSVTWEDLFERVVNSMKSCFTVTSGLDETTSKGKIPPIKLIVQTRSGNKKVTIVENLELYNVRLTEFSKECQHGVAASTTINKIPGRKYDSVLVQGNQVLFVYNLLIEKYKIPKKYIHGLENAPKTKK